MAREAYCSVFPQIALEDHSCDWKDALQKAVFTSDVKAFVEGFKEKWIGNRTVTVTELIPSVFIQVL